MEIARKRTGLTIPSSITNSLYDENGGASNHENSELVR